MDSWNNLTEEQKAVIRAGSRMVSDDVLNERFDQQDGTVTFRYVRKTDNALAGALDVDSDHDVDESTLDSPDESVIEDVTREFEFGEVVLIPPEEFDQDPEITQEMKQKAQPIDEKMAGFEDYYAEDQLLDMVGGRASAQLPNEIDHRPQQSPIRSQGSRGTCVAHASIALLESYPHLPENLSEQYTHYRFNAMENRSQNLDNGLVTTKAAVYLSDPANRVCEESDWPYIRNQNTINTLIGAMNYDPPPAALNNQTYGYLSDAYKIIPDDGLTGQSIKNTRYLEALLYQGYSVVIGTWVSWDMRAPGGVLMPQFNTSGDPIRQGGHAMLLVGYNRREQYFIVKNSWGGNWQHEGYGYLHYNLVRTDFKYGYVIDGVVPTEPPVSVPSKLRNAPYSTDKISRSVLRTAILFMKTSSGRYAVCEAYGGYNLHLRNLRVYNSDGSIHLEKPSLIVRGTYLCDLDSGTETRNDADFWWEAVRSGVNYLVPRNGAKAYIAFNVAQLSANRILNMAMRSAPIPNQSLDYAVVVGKTTGNRTYKLIAHAKPKNELLVSYLNVYDRDGSRHQYSKGITIPSSWTYNLDTLRMGGNQYADVWWHIISDNVGFLEKYSDAQTQLVWSL